MQVSHTFGPDSAVFDEDNLVSCAGLVPVMTLAEQAGLSTLLANNIRITSTRVKSGAANPVPKLTTLIAACALFAGQAFAADATCEAKAVDKNGKPLAGAANLVLPSDASIKAAAEALLAL